MLAAYGVVAAYAFGLLMNLSCWPFVLGAGRPDLAYRGRWRRWWRTSTASWSTRCSPRPVGWDTGRAITNVVAIVVLGPAVLVTLRRAARRAAFDAPVEFDPAR